MGKLIPLKLPSGVEIMVSEYKRDRISKYIDVLPSYKDILKVVLFGSALEERCRPDSDVDLCLLYSGEKEVYYRFLDNLWDKYEWTMDDDLIGFDTQWFNNNNSGALRDIKSKGVVLFDSE